MVETHRIEVLYKQALTWDSTKLLRRLLARRTPDDTQNVLALTVAMLSHQMHEYKKTADPFRDPERLAEHLILNTVEVCDQDKCQVILILRDIGMPHLQFASKSGQLQLLIRTCAKICEQFTKPTIELVTAIGALSKLVGRTLKLEDLKGIAEADVLQQAVDSTEVYQFPDDPILDKATKHFRLGEYVEAENLLCSSLIFVAQRRKIEYFELLGDTFTRSYKYEDAHNFLCKALEFAIERDETKIQVRILIKLADVCERLRDLDQAEHFYKISISFARGVTGPHFAHCVAAYSGMLRANGRLDDSKELEDRWTCQFCLSVTPHFMRVLPSMSVYACDDCVCNGVVQSVSVEDIENKQEAPWTVEQVKSLAQYQTSDAYLPFVCDKDHILKPRRDGLKCMVCGTTQTWTYNWTLDWSWKT